MVGKIRAMPYVYIKDVLTRLTKTVSASLRLHLSALRPFSHGLILGCAASLVRGLSEANVSHPLTALVLPEKAESNLLCEDYHLLSNVRLILIIEL